MDIYFNVRFNNVGYFTVFCIKRILYVKPFKISVLKNRFFFPLFIHPFTTRLAERGGVWSFGGTSSDWFAAVTDSDQ